MPEVIDSYKQEYGDIKISRIEGESLLSYEVEFPKLSEYEKQIIIDIKRMKEDAILRDANKIQNFYDRKQFLSDRLRAEISKKVRGERTDVLVFLMLNDLLEYGVLGPLMADKNLEDIMINGVESPVFVFHNKHGMCMTNIKFENQLFINKLINVLQRVSGKLISEENPLLDASMPDGSRANIAIAPAAPTGPSVVIRKFKYVPISVIDLIKFNTTSVDLMTFLWMCVEGFGIYPSNMAITGGTASGKTTTLNALAVFIPVRERVVTIEDTRELNFKFMKNWVPLESKSSIFGEGKINRYILLQNSLRMRPDRVIVGEVRGKEAESLFIAMNIGHRGSLSTLHSNSTKGMVSRLVRPPMRVPIEMIPLLDIVLVQNRIYDRKLGIIRRVLQVSEIGELEDGEVQIHDVYQWNSADDEIVEVNPPKSLKEKIIHIRGMGESEIDKELGKRKKIIEYMVDKEIKNNREVFKIIQQYYADPELVLSKIDSNELGIENTSVK